VRRPDGLHRRPVGGAIRRFRERVLNRLDHRPTSAAKAECHPPPRTPRGSYHTVNQALGPEAGDQVAGPENRLYGNGPDRRVPFYREPVRCGLGRDGRRGVSFYKRIGVWSSWTSQGNGLAQGNDPAVLRR
jgi:hypothetical protein